MASRAYPFLHFASGVDWKDVKPDILAGLNRLGASQKTVITITSGFRSVAEQQYLWDNSKKLGLVRGKTVAKPGSSDHNFGAAVDATVGGRPIGNVFSSKAFAKVGLKYLPGDPVHVTYLSSKEGGRTAAPSTAVKQDSPVAAQVPFAAQGVAPPSATPPPTALGVPGPEVPMPGSTDYSITPHNEPASLWGQVAQGDLVSPETQAMLRNATLSTTGV